MNPRYLPIAAAGMLALLSLPPLADTSSDCDASGDYAYVCGPRGAEDLVQVPGTQWIIASAYGAEGGMYLIDAAAKTWDRFYPGAAPRALQDMGRYGSCPGSPDPAHFSTHGLNLLPGDAALAKIEGTDLPYANGIEVAADGSEFFVASSGASTVTVYANSNPARRLRTSEPFAFIPDNLHRGPDGQLLTAGLNLAHPPCDAVSRSGDFDLAAFAACPRPFTVLSIDPLSLRAVVLATGPADARFSNITMALPLGDELWLGTFAGDRVAYRTLD